MTRRLGSPALLLAALLLAALVLSLALPPPPASARRGEDAPRVVEGDLGRALDRAVQETTNGMWWGAVLVAREDEVLLAKGYGYADYADVPCDANTVFEIASASKPFTAAAVLHLVQEGKLRLDTSVADLWTGVPDDKKNITVHGLLTHSSGLSNRIGVPYNSPLEREDYIRHILSTPVAEEPGEVFAYNNAGYAILAAIVEKVSGRSFEDYCRKHLFDPAGMKNTGFIQDAKLLRRENVAGRFGSGGKSAVDWHWGWGYRGMGGVVTTLHDLLRWDRALRGDRILDDETKAIYYEPVLESYACGWRVGVSPGGGKKVEHSGGVQGFTCQVERHLDDDVVIVVLTNASGVPFDIAEALRARLWPPVTIRAHLDASPYTLTPARAAELGSEAAWEVAKQGKGRVLSLVDGKGHTAARIELPPDALKGLLGELRAAMQQRMRDDAGGPPALTAGVYLVNHQGGAVHDLEEGLRLRVMPQYVGRGRSGERVEDRRATLILEDTSRGSWPVMVKMNVAATRALVEALED